MALLVLLSCKDDKKNVISSSSQKTQAVSSSHALANSSQAALFEEPHLQGTFGHQSLILGATATAELAKFDPQFQVWLSEDYLPQIYTLDFEQEPPSPAKLQIRAPFALVMDFNHDHKQDLVLHGHNSTQERFLALVSTPTGYKVQIVQEWEISDQMGVLDSKVYDWDQGRKSHGLPCYLEKTDSKEWDFAITCAQLMDSTGNIQDDPIWTDYRFKKGKWISHEAEV